MMSKIKKKLILNKCEIENCEVTDCLHLHHIIERTELETSNDIMNLCILCPNHHSLVHNGRLKIFGLISSTKLPNKRTLIYELDGIKNIDIEIPKIEIKPKAYKIY